MDVALSIVLGFAVIVLVCTGFTAPVFWSEIGEKLVFRKLLGVQVSEWSDVEAMKFNETKYNKAVTVASQRRNWKRRLEIALLESDTKLTIAIPPEHYDRIVKLAAEHGFVLDKSGPGVVRAGETAPGPSEVVSELPEAAPEPPDSLPEPSEPPQRLPELPKDAAKPSAGVTRLFDILTSPVESASETVEHTSKSAKSGSKPGKRGSKSGKRGSKSSKRRSKRSKRSRKKRR